MPLPSRTAVRLLTRLLVVWLVALLALWIAARDDGGRQAISEWFGYWIWWLMVVTGLKEYPTH